MKTPFRFGRNSKAAPILAVVTPGAVSDATIEVVTPTPVPEAVVTLPAGAVAPVAPVQADTTAAAVEAARAEGATAERTRIASILNTEAAAGREDLALHLALETDTTAEASASLLAKSPKASTQDGYQPGAGLAGLELAAPGAQTESAPVQLNAGDIYAKRRAAQ